MGELLSTNVVHAGLSPINNYMKNYIKLFEEFDSLSPEDTFRKWIDANIIGDGRVFNGIENLERVN